MSTHQNLYFSSLAGAASGLAAWVLSRLVVLLLPSVADAVAAAFLGAFTLGLGVFFFDRWTGTHSHFTRVLSAVMLGIAAGGFAALVSALARGPLASHSGAFRVITWALTGSLVGLAFGMHGSDRLRAVYASTGGLCGGALAGGLFAGLASSYPDVIETLSFVIAGMGVTLGAASAPMLVREGTLVFVRSSDARAQHKYGPKRKRWQLVAGDSHLLGSLEQTGSRQQEVDVWIPDSQIAPRHAAIFSKDGSYYLERCREIQGEADIARFPLIVKGRPVSKSVELKDDDDIVIGRTTLRFVTRQETRPASE